MPEFKFVTSGSPEGVALAPASRAVRGHAIRNALQRRSSQSARTGADEAEETISQRGRLRGRFRLAGRASRGAQPAPAREDEQQRTPRSGASSPGTNASAAETTWASRKPPNGADLSGWMTKIGSDRADPFNSLPIQSSPGVDALVRYFCTRYSLNSHAASADRRPWFPYAMQSALVLHATLALAAEFFSESTPKPDRALHREGLRQKGAALQLLRRRVDCGPAGLGTAEDLAAMAGICMLASIEAFRGNFEAASSHIEGLQAIMHGRGGPETFEHDYHLRRSMNWTDIQVAAGLGSVPKLPMFHTLDQVQLPPAIARDAAVPSLRHLDRLGEDAPFDVAEARRAFAALRQAVRARAEPAVAADNIRILMNVAYRAILGYLYGEPCRAPNPGQRRIAVLLTATHLFLYGVLRGIPSGGHLFRVLAARLRAALGELGPEPPALWVGNEPALLWILFVGTIRAADAVEDEERRWFAVRLQQQLGGLRTRHEEASRQRSKLRRVLQSFLWEDGQCSVAFDQVWQEFEES